MEDFNVYEGIMSGLREAAAYKQGDHSNCKVSVRKIPDPEYTAEDVVGVRTALNLTQSALARALGVPTRIVESWEAGKNNPSGAACRLLYLLDGDHSLLERLNAI